MYPIKREMGHVYDRLKVIKPYGVDSRGRMEWLCECECGKFTVVRGDNLRRGRVRSCGCMLKKKGEVE